MEILHKPVAERPDGRFTAIPSLDPAPVAAVEFNLGSVAAAMGMGIDAVAVYSTETVGADTDLHTRDFCPTVGRARSESTWAQARNAREHCARCLLPVTSVRRQPAKPLGDFSSKRHEA